MKHESLSLDNLAQPLGIIDDNIPLSVTVIGLLEGPVKPQISLRTLNVQFLAVVDSFKS